MADDNKPALGAFRRNRSHAEEAARLKAQREADPAYIPMKELRERVGMSNPEPSLEQLGAPPTPEELEQAWNAAARAGGFNREPEPEPDLEHEPVAMFIDWKTFWATDHTAEEWLAYPLLPAHRQTAIYAPAKTGKSLLGLDVCLAVATGRSILGGDKVEPQHVMYLDYEMTEDDLKERILDLGYDETDDLSYFHYSLQPPIAPLDTFLGGEEVLNHAVECEARLVVIDTYGRAVKGDENDADTVRAFYRHTGMALKRAGIALCRMDHSGKDLERGQRGSSAKNDDVDVIWLVTRSEGGLTLKRTHSRVSWVPETVNVAIEVEPVLRHVADSTRKLYAAGTSECATALDKLGVEIHASTRAAQAALKDAGMGRKRKVVCDALRFRKESLGLGLVADVAAVENPSRGAPLIAGGIGAHAEVAGDVAGGGLAANGDGRPYPGVGLQGSQDRPPLAGMAAGGGWVTFNETNGHTGSIPETTSGTSDSDEELGTISDPIPAYGLPPAVEPPQNHLEPLAESRGWYPPLVRAVPPQTALARCLEALGL